MEDMVEGMVVVEEEKILEVVVVKRVMEINIKILILVKYGVGTVINMAIFSRTTNERRRKMTRQISWKRLMKNQHYLCMKSVI